MTVFYHPDLEANTVVLSVEESRHCIKAMRKRAGDTVHLTDGKGVLAEAEIVSADLTGCVVSIIRREEIPARRLRLHLAVAPTKNADRMEWLTEKAVEIGIEKISFIICEHSERPKIDMERLRRIAIAALKQSQTCHLPEMETLPFTGFIEREKGNDTLRYIAWCDENNHSQLVHETLSQGEVLLLIGPEGDFSDPEIEMCRKMNFKEIKLGERRLRTETAALYGCFAIAAKQPMDAMCSPTMGE